MEGVAFELRWAVEEMGEAGVVVDRFSMVGGAAQSAVWPQVVADVTHRAVIVPSISQAASLGAAILAGLGAGVFPDPQAGYAALAQHDNRRVVPDAGRQPLYDAAFSRYQNAYLAMQRVFPQDSSFIREELPSAHKAQIRAKEWRRD
jgi:sugar (pentulose or hexulose) kinase